MKYFKSITIFMLLLLILDACARKSFPLEEAIDTLPAPVLEHGNSVVSETIPSSVTDEISQTAVTDRKSLYTEENPVTDPEELIRILEDLKRRFLNQFDKPGWYELKWLELQTIWIHISNSGSNKFDGIINYYEHEKYNGFLRPWDFLSLDGHYGRMNSPSLNDFYFVPLETPPPETVWENLAVYLGCDYCIASEHLDWMIQWIRDPDNHIFEKSLKDTEFAGWTSTYENEPVFVFRTKVKYLTNLPTQANGEKVEIEDKTFYFSLSNGGVIFSSTDWFFLSGNKGLDDLLHYNSHLITHFETLPEQVQALYDKCYQELIKFEREH